MKTTKKGFTLIELLIVIAIIGILAVAFVPSIMSAPAKGRDIARIADLSKIQKVLVNATLEGEVYPTSNGNIGPNLFIAGAAGDTWGDMYEVAFGGTIPTDPVDTRTLSTINAAWSEPGAYRFKTKPGPDLYAFGLYAKMETLEAGNTKCSAIKTGGTYTNIVTPTSDADSCYIILSE